MILISPDALRAAAERQRTIVDNVDETIGRITSMTSELDEAWDGGASVQAVEVLQGLRISANGIRDGLQDGVSMLGGLAEAFEALDDGGLPLAVSVRFDSTKVLPGVPHPFFTLAFSGQLRIEPDQVRDVAAQCEQIAEVYLAKANDLQNSLNTLESSWQGKSFNKFVATSTEQIDAMQKVSEALTEFADRIRNAANRYEEIDNLF